jgi:MFS family permease
VRSIAALWRHEPHARPYFLALGQSAVGTGAGYVGLLLVAYQRFASPWAVSLVLLADLVPAMLLGPLLGSVADRVDRRRCAIAADVARAAALAGICLSGDFAPMLALALVAGLGGTLFGAANGALMPALVAPDRLPAANGLYRVLRDGGVMLGPALAAGMLLLTRADLAAAPRRGELRRHSAPAHALAPRPRGHRAARARAERARAAQLAARRDG